MTRWILAVTAFVLLSGCATVATAPRPESYYSPASQSDDTSPLFKGEATVLSDSDIERIINYRLTLPKLNRIAVLNLSNASLWRFYSNDFVQLNDSLEREFIGTLRASGRVYDASFLPSLLVPESRTVPYLREAAARYQADLLLAYRTKCASYDKWRLLSATETRAYCSVEAALLDVRTGIVPFTSVSTKNVETVSGADDKNLAETIKKNELAAISKSLKEIADALVPFLNGVPVRQ